jgi:predicted ATP-dependent endonuclease of OLD family
MYLSCIEITNFRNFLSTQIEFNEGVNVIVGHNNAGKTNLLKALGLIFNLDGKKRLEIDDFCKKIDVSKYFEKDKENELEIQSPPKIKVSVTIKESIGDHSKNEHPEDKNVVYHWKTQITPNYEARLTYEFFLPEGSETRDYGIAVKQLVDQGKIGTEDYWKLLKQNFIRKYVARIYYGDEKLQHKVEIEDLSKFDFQFLDAVRDVEKQMFTGSNEVLKNVISYFLDDDIQSDTRLSNEEKKQQKTKRRDDFQQSSSEIIKDVIQRINKEPMLNYASDVGASLGGTPDFDGTIDEEDIFSVLRLLITDGGNNRIPITQNGLGYNNLIYISLLLAKMQMGVSKYQSSDEQKVYPMLLIEEPEAHLHPSMQYKLLKFLKSNLENKKQVRQIFITTHSTHITSAVELDEIICLHVTDNGELNVGYPGRVFDPNNDEDKKSKAYVKRFLDATKSDMLFAKRVILVEGIAEQLLLSCFANYVGEFLEDDHISIINVGGRYFKHFLKLFDYDTNNQRKKCAIKKKIACITDADPTMKKKEPNARWQKCFPFQLHLDNDHYDYEDTSTELNELLNQFQNHLNIGIFSYNCENRKTLEYELAFQNPTCGLLLTDNLAKKDVLQDLMQAFKEGKNLPDMLSISDFGEIGSSLIHSSWSEEDKKKALIAARYIQSVENGPGKGEHALILDYQLRQNLIDKTEVFNVPSYIESAIKYVC